MAKAKSRFENAERPFIYYPRGIVLETKFGKVRLTVTRLTNVFVEVGDESGNAHINDSRPALVYRDQEYIGSIHFEAADGKLSIADFKGSVSLSKRPQWNDAPRTHAAAMVEAIREAAQTYLDANPDLFRQADIADTNNALREAEQDENKARAAFGAATERVHKLRDRLAELETGRTAE